MNTHKTQQDTGSYIALGEYCLISAPTVNLPNGESCVPQHFYGYNHDLESVESILNHIQFSNHYPIFCAEDDQGLFIQVGIIGRENYQRNNPARSKKIVYGRKWRVEPNLPTSEIIQTVFLALKKAREHEIRELVTLSSIDGQKVSTPFNSHHDLPLMAECHSLFQLSETTQSFTIESIQQLLDTLRFDQTKIQCVDLVHRRNGKVLVDVMFNIGDKEQDKNIEFSELHGIETTLVLNTSSTNELLYALMDTLIQLSDRYVEKHFKFNGFNRFSREHDLRQIGEFSINTRFIQSNKLDEKGKQLITEHNCSVDESRAPNIKLEQQKLRLAESFRNIEMIEGFLPKGF
ncbi:hypothetical protein [Marinomonas sp. GJ51-6]|uniref:hypothetical protein n=1 Tax=Marinomonas sp. GJ51-6 TaxID=2992802 RepID=UPI002934F00A|nr:hypothetical protein [Marinomonas sp. GJ51-6]WOD06871.1 hypothetical protein ONZ50_14640 [Marinomonas sp. GJ51-6]